MAYPHIHRVRSWLLVFLLTVAPLHAFVITWSGVQFLAPWREVLVSLLLMTIAVERILLREKLAFDALDWVIVAYASYALLFMIFGGGPMPQRVLGFRFDVMPWILLLGVRHVVWEKPERYFKAAILSACGVMVLGILQSVVLPADFLTHFGYSVEQAAFTPDRPLTGCQYLEHTASVCRAIATFGGPTRYGTYLLLVLGLALPFAQTKRAHGLYLLVAALALVNIGLTYSRSIWIGALTMGAAMFGAIARLRLRGMKRGTRAFWLFVFLGVSTVLGLSLHQSQPEFMKTVLFRASSTSEHREFFVSGIAKLAEHPLGLGLGTVGPASIRFEKFLTENWYLQIALEMGIVGLALFIALLLMLVKKLYTLSENERARGLALGIIGIAVAGLFTHSFEETSTVLIFASLAGISLSKRQF